MSDALKVSKPDNRPAQKEILQKLCNNKSINKHMREEKTDLTVENLMKNSQDAGSASPTKGP
ncbi:MAG: hypothetical protein H8E74_00770 [Gammaproteobacteria bacterium]|nr:hypothetical protein [Gammaproteobacteria bacterium]